MSHPQKLSKRGGILAERSLFIYLFIYLSLFISASNSALNLESFPPTVAKLLLLSGSRWKTVPEKAKKCMNHKKSFLKSLVES
jgi:hypothetical protein